MDMTNNNKILIVDENINNFSILDKLINDEFSLSYNDGSEHVEEIVQSIVQLKPVCVLLEYDLKTKEGIDVLRCMQHNKNLVHVPVIMLTNEADPAVIVTCLKNNASNYLIKETITREILLETIGKAIKESYLNEMVLKQQEVIKKLSITDELTGIHNRRYFESRVNEEFQRARRNQSYFSLGIIDVDHFKYINDNYGHSAGDEVLKIIANCMSSIIRSTDIFCRFGGDEFAICLNEGKDRDVKSVHRKHIAKFQVVSEVIYRKVNKYLQATEPLKNSAANKDSMAISVSIGVVTSSENMIDFKDIYKEADELMYVSKKKYTGCVAHKVDGQIVFEKDKNVKE